MSAHQPPDDPRSRPQPPSRTWARMFADALRGVGAAFGREVNFAIHLVAAVAIVAAGALVGLSAERWCLLILCIAFVLTAEMFNTAIEHLARAVTRETNPEIRDALDIASGGVLVASVAATIIGCLLILGPLFAKMIQAG